MTKHPVPRHMQGTEGIRWAGIRSYFTRIVDKGFDDSLLAQSACDTLFELFVAYQAMLSAR